jgi:hypothetical protein
VKFSDELQQWLDSDAPKSLGAMNDVFEEKTFAVAIVLLMLVSATPLPTGGIMLVFQLTATLMAVQMALGRRTVWVPARTTQRSIPYLIRRVKWLEGHSSPRWAHLFARRIFLQLTGLLLLGFCIAASVAPPLTGLDTLPALGAVLIGLAILLEDVVVYLFGTIVGTGGVILLIAVSAAVLDFLEDIF